MSCIREWIATAASRAQREVVLTTPFINNWGVEWIEDHVLRAARARTEVAVGVGMARELSDDERRAISRVLGAEEYLSVRMLGDRRAGGASHAKAASIDRAHIMIGTGNYLSAPTSATKFDCALAFEDSTGAMFDHIRASLPTGTRDLLSTDTTRTAPPRGSAAVDLTTGIPVPPEQVGHELEWLRSLLVPLETVSSGGVVDVDLPKLCRVIASTLRSAQRSIEGRGTVTVQAVTTTDHREMMFDAVKRARRFVLIASHRISRYGADPRLIAAIRSAAERECVVVLLWGEESHTQGGDDSAEEARTVVSSLVRLSTDHKAFVFVNASGIPWHAKLVLVDDDVAIVGSYEYLNLAASERHGVGELSVLCHGRGVVGRIVRSIADHLSLHDPALASAVRSHGAQV